MPVVGDVAPELSGVDCQGRPVRLADFRGRRVILFFFPKSFSMLCTVEARAFRDHQARIEALGASLIGVSCDSTRVQCDFAAQERIDFALLGDESRALSRAWGVLWPVTNRDRRVTFVIGPDGRVEQVIHHELRVWRHLDDVLDYLQAHPLARSA